jgi:D-alanyl-lipoteichoic acid acyltransferase DltB (MBOAT superfamily)
VAGPIVRASDFIPQIYEKYQLTKQQFNYAIFLIINGLVKKMLISDYISAQFVDQVFLSPDAYGRTGFEVLMATYGYAIQIYCDFSGYTDIAIGISVLLGFYLPLNFNSPYKSDSITDFWRRWHISLSSWLKDYLYISLGGNRTISLFTYISIPLILSCELIQNVDTQIFYF